ncbi:MULTISPECIES: helix-turn-helix transcriptional regulator [unclassified Paenibacillus]|uniref:helix-turn-helix transcriptional regulator n=1 Tax=unclassified Paenibacillus TaxID=185978 RepID=UPI0004F8B22C|nr:helix-turn-helix transcriptional regulator [Paenibacillus sp. FSL H7-0737]AIQ24550.1 Cro/Cl family transcriptional regulator [Paenibacillus sp. FSL H7-0737]
MKNKIRDIRKKMKLSQEDLAIRCGVTRQTINAIENDKYDPTLTLAFKLSNQLKITVDQLFTYKEDSK